MPTTQIWRLSAHRIEADPGFRRTLRWYVGDELVVERKSTDEKVRLEAGADRMEVRFSTLGRHVWPIVLAFVLARAEVRRRRRQDEKRS